ncbi:dynamin family protein [Flavobacterium frigidarium]|uniref:Dynamin family protein n=1 Tax=Flavobacterium frigidarium TaxID=99286 RepID=A0ABV4KDB0_9FLAO
MKLNITYNSYTYKFEIKTDDKSFNDEESGEQCKQIIKENEKRRIEIWFESFLKKFGEDFSKPDLDLVLTTMQYEYNKIEEIISKVKSNKKWDISLKHNNIEDKNVLGKLHELINSIINEKDDVLYEKLKEKQVLAKIEDIEKREVSVVVVAPMSAGKSTLINALIGKDLLPSLNQATTAVICKIKDINGKEGFDAVVKNGKGEIQECKENIDITFIDKYNDKGNNEDIEIIIEGDIKNIDSSDFKLVLVDTPGPNNSQNIRHQEVTLNYIKDENNNPLILYVLNAQQLGTNDDKFFLKAISEFIKKNGSKAKERIVFVLNRIDALDPEKNPKSETLDKVIENCTNYLVNDFEISSPLIFPISAQFAKLALKEELLLGRNEKSELNNFKIKMLPEEAENYEGIDTIKFAPISQKHKELLHCEAKNDLQKASLHYSGLTALQIYINEYINNTHKIEITNELINAIRPALHNVIIEHEKTYFSSDDQIKKCNEDLEKLTPFLSEKFLEEKKRLSDRINVISDNNEHLSELEAKVKKVFSNILLKLNNPKIKSEQASQLLNQAKAMAIELQNELSSTVTSENNKNFKNVKTEIQNFIEASFKQLVINANLSDQNEIMMKNHIQINVSSTIDKTKYKSKEQVVVNQEVSDSNWYNPFSWGRTKVIDIKEIIEVEYVNLIEIYNTIFNPLRLDMIKDVGEVIRVFKENVKILKDDGVLKVQEIEENLKEIINQEKMVKVQKELSESIKIKKQQELDKMKFYQNEIEKIIN